MTFSKEGREEERRGKLRVPGYVVVPSLNNRDS